MTGIGFLGLGAMGQAIAGRLVDAGLDVTVWNRNAGATEDLLRRGATLASSPQEALSQPISFSMLADDDAVADVLATRHLAGPPGRIHVCMSSISPHAADELNVRLSHAGMILVSAPVLGRPAVAQEGKLNILAAGPSTAIEIVEPLLLHCGVKVWNFGDTPRLANAVKVSVNYTILHALQAMAEGITLVESQGVSAEDFVELLTSTLFSAPIYSIYGNIIAEQNYSPPGFKMALGLKDLKLAESLAQENEIQLPSSELLHHIFDVALNDEKLSGLDWAAMAEVTRRQNHERII